MSSVLIKIAQRAQFYFIAFKVILQFILKPIINEDVLGFVFTSKRHIKSVILVVVRHALENHKRELRVVNLTHDSGVDSKNNGRSHFSRL